jgi:glutamate-1-semialdehyde aminotransferase
MTSVLKLWKRAKKVIPSGNSFLSKNPSRFLVKNWPIYYLKSKGSIIWTLNNKKFIDFCFMGVGTNILGYNNVQINNSIKKVIKSGNMTTLNCPEEVYLAEKLISIHPWAKKVKFARTGGEANSLAVRVARATTKKEKIIVCGYHGWHDWYLSANLKKNSSLDTHLFPNLKTEGVPSFLKGTTYSFKYNDFETLKEIIRNDRNIACLIMEVERDQKPQNDFLKKIRKICSLNKIVLIFDECTTGFRECLGGIHLKHKVYPDIAMFGKSLGNGYAITAIIGRNFVMKNCSKTFMSSTFWSERIGFAAGVETLKQMSKLKSWKIIKKKGQYIKKNLIKIANKYNLELEFTGIDSLIRFKIKNIQEFYLKTFISEFLKRDFLATNVIYVSVTHTKKIIDLYLKNADKIFEIISKKFFKS